MFSRAIVANVANAARVRIVSHISGAASSHVEFLYVTDLPSSIINTYCLRCAESVHTLRLKVQQVQTDVCNVCYRACSFRTYPTELSGTTA
jgi:hypothetical protein